MTRLSPPAGSVSSRSGCLCRRDEQAFPKHPLEIRPGQPEFPNCGYIIPRRVELILLGG